MLSDKTRTFWPAECLLFPWQCCSTDKSPGGTSTPPSSGSAWHPATNTDNMKTRSCGRQRAGTVNKTRLPDVLLLCLLSYPSEHQLFDPLWVLHSPLWVQKLLPSVQRWSPGYTWSGTELHPLHGKTDTNINSWFTTLMSLSIRSICNLHVWDTAVCSKLRSRFPSLTQVMSSKPGSSSDWGGRLGSWEFRE